jgi:biopolymer transport protein ExbB
MKLLSFLNRHRLLLIVIALAFAFGTEFYVNSLHAQGTPPAEGAAPAPAEGEAPGVAGAENETVWQIIKNGGWIMGPLAVLSVWCVALIIECFIRIRLGTFAPPDIVMQLRQAFGEENYQQAWRVCKSRSSFLTNVLLRGLERIGRGRSMVDAVIAEHSLKESMLFRTRVSYLSSIGVVSPMVGLLGTVTGMIKAFKTLGTGGIADPSLLAAAIGEVLIATATGLMIAIPAFFAYYFLRNRLQTVVVLVEDIINQLLIDVNFDELQGVKIGEGMDGQAPAGGATTAVDPNKRVSQAITGVTVACPQCNATIAPGTPRCASCGTELQWT